VIFVLFWILLIVGIVAAFVMFRRRNRT